MKWSLKLEAKDSYAAACAGDAVAESNIRAYVTTLNRDRNNRWKTKRTKRRNRKKRTMKRLLTSAAALLLAVTLVGCKNAAPLSLTLATSTIVSYGLRNSPQTAGYLRDVQPVVCSVAMGTNLTPAQVVAAIEGAGIDDSAEGRLIVNGILLIYIAAFDSLESNTNTASVSPYARAVFCDGFELGLIGAPASKSRNAPPVKTVWPLLRR